MTSQNNAALVEDVALEFAVLAQALDLGRAWVCESSALPQYVMHLMARGLRVQLRGLHVGNDDFVSALGWWHSVRTALAADARNGILLAAAPRCTAYRTRGADKSAPLVQLTFGPHTRRAPTNTVKLGPTVFRRVRQAAGPALECDFTREGLARLRRVISALRAEIDIRGYLASLLGEPLLPGHVGRVLEALRELRAESEVHAVAPYCVTLSRSAHDRAQSLPNRWAFASHMHLLLEPPATSLDLAPLGQRDWTRMNRDLGEWVGCGS